MLVFREEQPEWNLMQNDCSDIWELDTQPAENVSLLEHKANCKTGENMWVVSDNYDAPVIHADDNNNN